MGSIKTEILTSLKFFLTSLIFLLTIVSIAQEKEDDFENTIKPYVFASINYSKTLSGKVLPANGFHGSLGINLARFFKQKFIIGPLVEFRGFKILGSNDDYGRKRDDVNKYLIGNQNNPSDSTRAPFLSKAFNSDETIKFWGSYMLTYGIMLSPFPNEYGGFMLQIKRGGYTFPIYGAHENPHLSTNTSDFTDLVVPIDFNVQLTFKPLTFIKCKNEKKDQGSWRNNFFLSLFYEKISLRRASIDGADLTKFLEPEFFDRYGTDNHFGVKLSYGIY